MSLVDGLEFGVGERLAVHGADGVAKLCYRAATYYH